MAKPNDRIGVVIRTEELHGKNAAFFEKVEHGKCPQIRKTHAELAVTEDDRPVARDKDSVVFTLMASWWRGLDNGGLTIGIALIVAVIVWAAMDEVWGLRSIELHFP